MHFNILRRGLLSLVLCSLCLAGAAQVASFGVPRLFNDGWKFSLEADSAAAMPGYDDSQWRVLDLPHDWSIEAQPSPTLASCTGYLPGGVGWYRKSFAVTDSLPCHFIYFEGVYNRSEVYLNGHLLGSRPNGYISFLYDMTPWLQPGENVLAVRVDHSRYADSRWYTGSGIYRPVYIVSAPETHFALWGVGYEASRVSPREAVVTVDAAVVNPVGSLSLTATLEDAAGRVVARRKISSVRDSNTLSLRVRNPRLWDIADPALYTLRVALARADRQLDTVSMRVGIRTLAFSPDSGFALNGRSVKVKGVCLHHDAGVLGAVVPREVWHRRLSRLRDIGVNAIRMSHNPQAPVLYDLCDELGLLVMDEASDEWEFPKRKWITGWNCGTPSFDGTYDFFEEWIDRDVADMVRRDRHHPSVFLWSIGNEVDYPNDPYSHPVLDGSTINQPMFGGFDPRAPRAERIGDIARRLAARVKAVDTSRPVTGAMAGVVMSNETDYPSVIDVCGYNYTEDRYLADHAAYPSRVIYGSENGVGYPQWKAVRDNDFIFGQFIWTGTDYLGESGRWPSRGLGTGLLDFASLQKPRGRFRATLWCDEPKAFIGTFRPWSPDALTIDADATWNYEPGDTVRVVAYTNTPASRLTLDGRQVGALKLFNDSTGITWWDIPFAPGRLVLEGCDTLGNVLAADSAVTTGAPVRLRAYPDDTLPGAAVRHIVVEALDAGGNRVVLADNNIRCQVVEGDADILGLENGDNADMTNFRTQRRLHRGRLLLYLRRPLPADGSAPAPATVRFTSPLLSPAVVTVP